MDKQVAREPRIAVLERIRQRWETLPFQSADLIKIWKEQGRP
jgi:hypothetical protein